MKEKIILAYSGGLDTTTIIPWLKENYDCEVIAVCVNVGQDELDGLEQRALEFGASKCIVIDAVDEFANDYLSYLIKSTAMYENKYLLGSSISRPLISKKLVEIANKEKATAICHGATGKGNDQVRFELSIRALNPFLKIIAPWRIWDIQSREDAFDYLKTKGFNPTMNKDQSYSRDANIWHISTEGLELEDPSLPIDFKKVLQVTTIPQEAPDYEEEIEIEFEKGLPISLNGEKLDLVKILEKLNKIGAKNGIGIVDMVENRVVGMKSHGIYETPGGTILYFAHQQIEHLCIDKDTLNFKNTVSQEFANLIYSGKWDLPLSVAIKAFINETQKNLDGVVKLKLYKGNIILAGMESPYSLYIEDLASFKTGELYNHEDAEGFIKLFGLPLQVKAMIDLKK